mmetsp:Transcript_60354/g.156044  ORF Transcript_60354/g.156044 Transcript_60354/m.156044 type:complete len:282 (-) Transcript_60354:135-980(-)
MAISNESVLAASKASWTPFASLKVTSTIFARSADLVIKLGREASSPNAAKVSRSTSTMDLSPMAKSSSEKLLRASRLLGVAVLAGAKSLIGTVPGTINGTTVGGTTVGGLTLGAAEAGTPFTRGGRTEGCFGLIGGSTILGATILGSTTFACPTTCGAVAATGSFLGAGSNRSRRGTDGVDPKGAAADAALADAAAFFASSSSCSFRSMEVTSSNTAKLWSFADRCLRCWIFWESCSRSASSWMTSRCKSVGFMRPARSCSTCECVALNCDCNSLYCWKAS